MMENLAWVWAFLAGGVATTCAWWSGWCFGKVAGRREVRNRHAANVAAFGAGQGTSTKALQEVVGLALAAEAKAAKCHCLDGSCSHCNKWA